MNKQEILTYLEELIKKIAETDDYSSDMDLSDDLGLSSIDIMSLLVACEKKFSVKISARELRRRILRSLSCPNFNFNRLSVLKMEGKYAVRRI